MLFLVFEIGDQQRKLDQVFLRLGGILFLIFEIGDQQKIGLVFLRFLSTLF